MRRVLVGGAVAMILGAAGPTAASGAGAQLLSGAIRRSRDGASSCGISRSFRIGASSVSPTGFGVLRRNSSAMVAW